VAYALISILLALALLADLLIRGPAPAAPSTHVAAVATLLACAAFTGSCYAWKWAGGEPEGLLDRAPPAARGLSMALLGPYTLIAGVVVFCEHRLSGERFADALTPDLWVGRVPWPWEGPRVRSLGVRAVLNLCAEFGDLARLGRSPLGYARIPVFDATAPSAARLEEAVAWCEARLRAGDPVLVHCAHGHGRSALVAAATLLTMGEADDPAQALEAVRRARPGVNLSDHQLRALETYHRRSSRK
jgi:hypothetical protein